MFRWRLIEYPALRAILAAQDFSRRSQMTNAYELAEYLSIERTIPAPVRKVWPVFLDMNRWYTDYHWDWISGPPYEGVGLQEGQVLRANPLYGVGLQDSTLYYFQEQLKVTTNTEIVVKITANNPKSMSAEYGTEVRDVVAFYHWQFIEARASTTLAIRSYSNIRTEKRPSETVIAQLTALFHGSWNKSLDNLEALACASSTKRTTQHPK
jgi:hypothetical protein